MSVVTTRPAEAGGAAAAVGLLIARLAGVTDADTIVAIGIVIGFVPAAITWIVTLARGSSGKQSGSPTNPA